MLRGRIFIPYAVHGPMNPSHSSERGKHSSDGDHRQGLILFYFCLVDTSVTIHTVHTHFDGFIKTAFIHREGNDRTK